MSDKDFQDPELHSEYFPDERRFRIYNKGEHQRKFIISGLCLDTNLCFFRGWAIVPGGGLTDTTFPNEFPEIHDFGVRIVLWEESTMEKVYSCDHPSGRKQPRSLFSAPPEELSYGPWDSLVFGNEFEGLLQPQTGDIVYDLGGNLGTFSGWVHSQVQCKAIYIFEPTQKIIPHLRLTFAECPEVKIFDVAITGDNSERIFYEFENSVANTLLDFNGKNHTFLGGTKAICRNLEQFVQENNLLPPTFIKYDIESSEYESIAATSDQFFDNVRCLSLEYHDNTGGKVFDLIKRFLHLGFKIKLKSINSLDALSGNLILWK